jgi:hypothetical protein
MLYVNKLDLFYHYILYIIMVFNLSTTFNPIMFMDSVTKVVTNKKTPNLLRDNLMSVGTLSLLIIIIVDIIVKSLTIGQTGRSWDNFIVNYGSINSFKWVLLTILIIILVGMDFTYRKFVNSWKKVIPFAIVYLLLLYYVLFHHIRHCTFNWGKYASPNEKNLESYENINMFATGDIQNIYHHHHGKQSQLFVNRRKATQFYIDVMNDLQLKIADKNYLDITFINEDNKNLLSNEVICAINPGDCCQTNTDGRIFSSNNIGHYEYSFPNNPDDTGLLNLPTYECLGNHDYDMNTKIQSPLDSDLKFKLKRILWGDSNAATNMQLRRNKNRGYIVNQDDEGNYSCNMGDMHIIFMNVWPEEKGVALVGADPGKSLDFLSDDLEKYKDKKWILITHYIPFKKDFTDPNEMGHGADKSKLSRFAGIINKYKDNCEGFFFGHGHVDRTLSRTDKNGIAANMLAGPAGKAKEDKKTHTFTYDDTKLELPLINYNKATKKVTLLKIIAERDGNNFKYTI